MKKSCKVVEVDRTCQLQPSIILISVPPYQCLNF